MHKDAPLTIAESPPPLDPRSALFLDVDGTLLEIAPRPELVHVPDGLPALMIRCSAEREGALALISGRPLAQLDRLFQPWQGAAAGLHGLERRRADGNLDCVIDRDSATALDRLRPKLAELAADGTGLMLEDKIGTLALHYRAAPQRAQEIRAVVERLHGEIAPVLRLITGKMVVEFQPRGADKGRAIAAFLAEPPFFGRRPVFVGDDTTDEDGFAEIRRRSGIAIRIGPSDGATAANYRLPSVEAVLAWLASGGLG
ncbi:MAG: trehalose-phosphatase [Alphaproteobacteria bacterium]|nr:trehalose-phosphatase [Alphaproteobacteria bacterium]